MFGRGSRRSEIEFDPNPSVLRQMPARPYKVLHADLPVYSDSSCKAETNGVRMVILRCEDPKQTHRPTECMPSRKRYSKGQVVSWELNNKSVWNEAWYRNPETGKPEKAWSRAVEFEGRVVEA
jgi:hypothetical protein